MFDCITSTDNPKSKISDGKEDILTKLAGH